MHTLERQLKKQAAESNTEKSRANQMNRALRVMQQTMNEQREQLTALTENNPNAASAGNTGSGADTAAIDQLRAEVAQLRAERDAASTREVQQTAEIERLVALGPTVLAQMGAVLAQKRQQTDQKMRDLEAQVAQLNTQLDQERNKIDDTTTALQAQVAQLATQLDQERNQITDKTELTALQAQVVQLTTQVDQERNRTDDTITALEAQVAQLNAQLDQERNRTDDTTTALQAQVAQLTTQLDQERNKPTDKTELTSLQTELQKANFEVASHIARANSQRSRVEELSCIQKEEVAELQKELAQLNTQLENERIQAVSDETAAQQLTAQVDCEKAELTARGDQLAIRELAATKREQELEQTDQACKDRAVAVEQLELEIEQHANQEAVLKEERVEQELRTANSRVSSLEQELLKANNLVTELQNATKSVGLEHAVRVAELDAARQTVLEWEHKYSMIEQAAERKLCKCKCTCEVQRNVCDAMTERQISMWQHKFEEGNRAVTAGRTQSKLLDRKVNQLEKRLAKQQMNRAEALEQFSSAKSRATATTKAFLEALSVFADICSRVCQVASGGSNQLDQLATRIHGFESQVNFRTQSFYSISSQAQQQALYLTAAVQAQLLEETRGLAQAVVHSLSADLHTHTQTQSMVAKEATDLVPEQQQQQHKQMWTVEQMLRQARDSAWDRNQAHIARQRAQTLNRYQGDR